MPTAWDSVPVRREVVIPIQAETDDSEIEVVDERTNYERVFKASQFGVVLGAVCGTAYGIMESFGTAEGRRPDKLREALLNIRLQAAMFAGGFAVFQASKESVRLYRGTKPSDPYDPINAVIAAGCTITPMMYFPTTRRIFPHMLFLIAVDSVNESGYKLY
mmetsp:Transcript_17078/g.20106  ORF Transcript_17078/g.20106 Transcript_17078/m.20106 type:complete len:161 (+) Transcript_17078:56-538(+)|eukprot:CAMPEP_0114358612 /NCGR_PEP_ID=MMETSP0101-20121206/22425_1 /TAXON_ID=38822 ORGANISM="Pteridomonas danica, Strain PT" /NCGR_SAMPLE_ID=MMETSP0101 /ASSEMBLY_ACC=CAM_ASM_000211 /LENGTH=160 /DNA_ID=CAMNT_0001501797 /DNA_START=48 /DNA_END=530 /DNA_ORIENTATION=-